MLTGSDSAPAKANEAKQKNDIGAARDQVYLFASNAQTEAYERIYVKGKQATSNADVTAGNASKNVSDYVKDKIDKEYGNAKKVGLATIVATDDGATITISTTDWKQEGNVADTGGTLTWKDLTDNNDTPPGGSGNGLSITPTISPSKASYNKGDLVTLGTGENAEDFYVIETSDSNSSTLKLLPKYCIETTNYTQVATECNCFEKEYGDSLSTQISAYISALNTRTGITITSGELIDYELSNNLSTDIIISPNEHYWLADDTEYNEKSLMKVTDESYDWDVDGVAALRPVITITKP